MTVDLLRTSVVLYNSMNTRDQPAAPTASLLKTVHICFAAEVNRTTTENLLSILADVANAKVKQVCLMISTSGGSIAEGITLYNILRAFPFLLVTHNIGNVDSIGNVIFLAGKKRYACPHSVFSFHSAGYEVAPHTRFEEGLLKNELRRLHDKNSIVSTIMQERTKLRRREIDQLFLEFASKDAVFAQSKGIIHSINDIIVPRASSVILVKR